MAILQTASEVIAELGGDDVVARMFGVGYTAVRNWARDNIFPARTHWLMSKRLKARGHKAPISLWNFAFAAPAADGTEARP